MSYTSYLSAHLSFLYKNTLCPESLFQICEPVADYSFLLAESGADFLQSLNEHFPTSDTQWFEQKQSVW